MATPNLKGSSGAHQGFKTPSAKRTIRTAAVQDEPEEQKVLFAEYSLSPPPKSLARGVTFKDAMKKAKKEFRKEWKTFAAEDKRIVLTS